jgi:hypothetical protein
MVRGGRGAGPEAFFRVLNTTHGYFSRQTCEIGSWLTECSKGSLLIPPDNEAHRWARLSGNHQETTTKFCGQRLSVPKPLSRRKRTADRKRL